MRLHKYAGLMAGALVASALTVPMLASPASAAEPVTVSRDYECAYGDFSLPYTVTAEVTATGTEVSATLNDMPATGFPTGLKVAGFKAQVGLNANGAPVQLSGENTYPSNIAGGGAGNTVNLPMPEVEGTRTGTADLKSVSIASLGLVMKAGFQFNPAGPPPPISDNELTCEAGPETVTATRTFQCAFGDFSLPYPVTALVMVEGTDVTAVLNDMAATSFPTGLKVAGFRAEMGLRLNGVGVSLAGENTYASNISGGGPGNTVDLPMPTVEGTRTGAAAVTAASIASLNLVMKAGFQFNPAGPPPTITDNELTCVAAPADVTTTTLTATSPAAGTVNLAAAVAPSADGKVEFYEGAAKVGEKVVASGAAPLSLAGVAAGAHTYTAKFVPSDDAVFQGSTSAAATVTVAATGPSAACVKAQGDEKAALTAVNAANTKVTKAKAAVKKAQTAAKKAQAKVKKADGKKAKSKAKAALKKAKAKVKKANKDAASANKALTAAKTKHTAATAAVKAAC